MSRSAVNRGFAAKILCCLLLILTLPAGAETWRFAVIGDTPYSDRERTELPKMLAAIGQSPVELLVHIGDIKHGADRCDDALFADRHQLFGAVEIPFMLVPGDNEWTDCDRLSNGGYDPLERLAALRRLFWDQPFTLGRKKLSLERQAAGYPEHARLRIGPVLFVTLNLPGGNNNWGMTDTPRAEYLARNPAVLDWLSESFTLAREKGLRGIVLLFQANPGFTHMAQGFPHRGYRDFLNRLRDETVNFSGQVVAVHGDTHISRIDHPLRDEHGRRLGNFTRVETFGYPIMGWTRGVIDTELPGLFRFETHPWPPAEP